MLILKKRGIYTNKKQVEDLFALADRWTDYGNARFIIDNFISNGDSQLSKSELRTEMKRLQNTEKAYSLMDSDK